MQDKKSRSRDKNTKRRSLCLKNEQITRGVFGKRKKNVSEECYKFSLRSVNQPGRDKLEECHRVEKFQMRTKISLTL